LHSVFDNTQKACIIPLKLKIFYQKGESMKKFIALLFVVVMLFGVITFTLAKEPLPVPPGGVNGDTGTGGGTSLYIRSKEACPQVFGQPTKWEYHCEGGGNELCSITNC